MVAIGKARMRLGSAGFFVGGVCLAVFPLVRPFGALEAQSSDAAAVAAQVSSPAWVVSHLMATFGFIFLLAGMFVLYLHLARSRAERAAFAGFVLCLFGAALVGAVAGLEGIGLRAMGVLQQEGKGDVIAGVALLRFGPSVVLFPTGLLLLAAGAVVNTRAMWQSGIPSRWAAIALGVGLVFFFPLLPRVIRIADGFLTGVGALGLAWNLWRGGPAGHGV
jgi:hypothetical protein